MGHWEFKHKILESCHARFLRNRPDKIFKFKVILRSSKVTGPKIHACAQVLVTVISHTKFQKAPMHGCKKIVQKKFSKFKVLSLSWLWVEQNVHMHRFGSKEVYTQNFRKLSCMIGEKSFVKVKCHAARPATAKAMTIYIQPSMAEG